MKGIRAYSEEPLVSSDLKGAPHSSILSALDTLVIGGDLAKVVAWYDNEFRPGPVNYWGYCPVTFFAPHAGCSSRRDPLGPVHEFRDLVKALHRAAASQLPVRDIGWQALTPLQVRLARRALAAFAVTAYRGLWRAVTRLIVDRPVTMGSDGWFRKG